MFGERLLKNSEEEITTVLDQGAQFEGKLTFDGSVQINGKFRGEIFSGGHLLIGEGAEIEAKIEVNSISIQGTVRGNIQAKQKIEMRAPAEVRGEIKAPALVIQEGAIFEGNCSMGRILEHSPSSSNIASEAVILDLPRRDEI